MDEILKTSAIGTDFSNLVRSQVCKWVDSKGICDVVLFSSIDLNFITKERSDSGRPISAVTTLPLLQQSDSVALLQANISVDFVDDEGTEIEKIAVLNQLALASGGHPRPLEYIIDGCNECQDPSLKIDIMNIITTAARKLSDSCGDAENWKELFYIVMLAEKVKKNDKVGKEKFSDLARRGVLIHSFDESSDSFTPAVPELFLHKWLLKDGNGGLSNEIRKYLDEILRLRSNFTEVRFEIMHSSWEKLMRHVRQSKPRIYKKNCLNDLYSNTLRHDATFAASCLVDGCSSLREIQYVKDSKITLDPNTIYNPKFKQNKGWDRLIIMEAFPNSNNKRRYIIPVFIQNKFSDEGSRTTFSADDAIKALGHCQSFFENMVTLAPDSFFCLRWERSPRKYHHVPLKILFF